MRKAACPRICVYPFVDAANSRPNPSKAAPSTAPQSASPDPLTREERTEMGARLRRGAMFAVKYANRLDPEHATVIVCEVNRMGQVAKILGGLKSDIDAKDQLITQRDAQIAQQSGEIGQLEQTVKSLSEQVAQLQNRPVLDAEDQRAIADAEPLVNGVLVENVVQS